MTCQATTRLELKQSVNLAKRKFLLLWTTLYQSSISWEVSRKSALCVSAFFWHSVKSFPRVSSKELSISSVNMWRLSVNPRYFFMALESHAGFIISWRCNGSHHLWTQFTKLLDASRRLPKCFKHYEQSFYQPLPQVNPSVSSNYCPVTLAIRSGAIFRRLFFPKISFINLLLTHG